VTGKILQEETLKGGKTSGGDVVRVAPDNWMDVEIPGNARFVRILSASRERGTQYSRYFVLLIRPCTGTQPHEGWPTRETAARATG